MVDNWWYKRKGGWFYAKKEVENIEQKFFVWGFVFEKIDLESVHRNLIRRAEVYVRQNGQTFSAIFVIINFMITSYYFIMYS